MTLYELGPRARRVYQLLLERIRSSELAPGTRLPAHTRLAASFGVAPLTMRQVLARLEAERLIVRERGRGTFVRAPDSPYVLIVDADPEQRGFIEQQVRAAANRPVLATTPAEALATLAREALPSLAIVNLYLPDARAGLGLVRMLRQRLTSVPIAVVNPSKAQRTRLEHTVAPPLVFLGDAAPDQLSQVLTRTPELPRAERQQRLLERYLHVQLAGERTAARLLLRQDGLASGLNVAELYRSILQPAQYRVGELWQTNQISVAREHLATGVTEAVMVDLAASAPPAPDAGMCVLVACVEGEQHDIGARMVADLLELDGFSVRFLGADVPTDSLLEIIREESPRLLVLSAAMAERLVVLRTAVGRVRQMYGGGVRIFVGGQILHRAPEAVHALEVDLAAIDALDTLASARRLLTGHELRS